MTSNQSKDSQACLSSTNSCCSASLFAIRSKWAPLQIGYLEIRKFLGSGPRRVSTLLGRARQGTMQELHSTSYTPSLSVLGMSLRKLQEKSYFTWLQFGTSNRLKRIQTPHSLCCDFGGDQTFSTRWLGGRVQVWVQVWSPAGHLAISLKAGNRRFRGQSQLPSSWGSSQALLGRVWLASTNTGCFLVCCSRCGQQPACSSLLAWGKHATTLAILTQFKSDTDSVQEWTMF